MIEPLPEMKREVAHNAMSLMEKAHLNDFTALSVKVENEYPTLKAFSQLQSTVSNKAEWIDVNDLSREHRQTHEMLKTQMNSFDELKQNFL